MNKQLIGFHKISSGIITRYIIEILYRKIQDDEIFSELEEREYKKRILYNRHFTPGYYSSNDLFKYYDIIYSRTLEEVDIRILLSKYHKMRIINTGHVGLCRECRSHVKLEIIEQSNGCWLCQWCKKRRPLYWYDTAQFIKLIPKLTKLLSMRI